jgi:hypothetical protein
MPRWLVLFLHCSFLVVGFWISSCRKQAITRFDPETGILSAMAMLQQLSLKLREVADIN